MELYLWIILSAVAGVGAGSVGGNVVRKRWINQKEEKILTHQKEIILQAKDEAFEIKEKVRLARKNIYRVCAKELEKSGKRAGTIRYYERLIKMDLENIEKEEIKRKLLSTYQSLGMFREAKLLEKV